MNDTKPRFFMRIGSPPPAKPSERSQLWTYWVPKYVMITAVWGWVIVWLCGGW